MTERWQEAVWLGKRWHNDEHWCFDLSNKCMYSARSIRLQHDGEQWNFEKINLVCCTPWKLNGDKLEVGVPGVIPFTESETVEAMPKVPVYMPRDFKITEDIIKKVGYSEGCLKCGAMQRGDPDSAEKRHSGACRTRVYQDNPGDLEFGAKVKEKRNKKMTVTTPMVNIPDNNTDDVQLGSPAGVEPSASSGTALTPLDIIEPNHHGYDDEPTFAYLQQPRYRGKTLTINISSSDN